MTELENFKSLLEIESLYIYIYIHNREREWESETWKEHEKVDIDTIVKLIINSAFWYKTFYVSLERKLKINQNCLKRAWN